MPFTLVWLDESASTFQDLEAAARKSLENRLRSKKANASKQEGLFKQVLKCIELLQANPRHPGLNTHEYDSIENPYDPATKVFEAYVQNRTPGAYRVFWCYGPNKSEIRLLRLRRIHNEVSNAVPVRTCPCVRRLRVSVVIGLQPQIAPKKHVVS